MGRVRAQADAVNTCRRRNGARGWGPDPAVNGTGGFRGPKVANTIMYHLAAVTLAFSGLAKADCKAWLCTRHCPRCCATRKTPHPTGGQQRAKAAIPDRAEGWIHKDSDASSPRSLAGF